MSRVFVVQDTLRRDFNGDLARVFDLSSAEKYGNLTFVLTNERLPRDLTGMIEEWRQKLTDFCDDDHLLCIGDPVAIGISTAFAAAANEGRIKFLRWSPKSRTYEEIIVDLWQGVEYPEDAENEAEDVSFWR